MPDPRRYLVTGGAGFIGSHLCDALLAAGHAVVVLDDLSTGRRANLPAAATLIQGSVADPAAVAQAAEGADGIFHLAAIASVARGNEDWTGTHRVNQGGTVAVLDAARAHGRLPVVYASSAAVYGDTGDAVASEDRRPAPRTAYGADKLGSELHAAVATLVHRVPTLGLRFFNVYGPRQDPASPYSGVISIFARRIAAGDPVELHGDGLQLRDFVHVADVVAHLLAAMRHLEHPSRTQAPPAHAPAPTTPAPPTSAAPPTAALPAPTTLAIPAAPPATALPGPATPMPPIVLNVCTGRAVSIRALAETLARRHGATLRLAPGPIRPGDIRSSRGSFEAAEATLGLRATIPLEDGLADLS